MVMAHPSQRLTAAFLAALGLGACSTKVERLEFSMPTIAPQVESRHIWPPAPEVPRYMYIGDLRGESNKLENPDERRSPMARFFAALVGLDSDQIPLVDVLRPQQVVSDNNGKIYVTDPGRRAVLVFRERESRFSVWNEATTGVPLASPIGLAVHQDKVFVSDSERARILVFDQQGEFLFDFGRGDLVRPTGLGIDDQRQQIIVSDTGADTIKFFDMQGKLVESLGKRGDKAGQFNRPTFLHYHDNRIYVTDSLNARVQVIDRNDNSIRVFGERGLYVGNFSRPKGLAVDYDGNIYVTESYYDYLLIFNPEGKLLLAFGGPGSQPGKFSQPTGVWVDNTGRLFVSDMLNSRISIFQYLGDG